MTEPWEREATYTFGSRETELPSLDSMLLAIQSIPPRFIPRSMCCLPYTALQLRKRLEQVGVSLHEDPIFGIPITVKTRAELEKMVGGPVLDDQVVVVGVIR